MSTLPNSYGKIDEEMMRGETVASHHPCDEGRRCDPVGKKAGTCTILEKLRTEMSIW